MGILNVTPDSFSDGAELAQGTRASYSSFPASSSSSSRSSSFPASSAFKVDLDKVLRRADAMLAEGAQILDIGGESTRPGASEVSVAEELERVIPVIEVLRSNLDIGLSIDTGSPEVMGEAINAGINLVNDIRAMSQPGTLEQLSESNVAICLMHMQGQPRTMQQGCHYDDVVLEVCGFLRERVDQCLAAGIKRERLLIDPGFGFGKTVEHNFRLLKNLNQLLSMDIPVLVGLSRKSMLGAATDKPVNDRLAASVAAATLALQGGAKILRVHDVAATVDAIRVHFAYRNN